MVNSFHVAVIGLGYVGLPLALELSKKMPVTGFDLSKDKVEALQKGTVPLGIVSDKSLKESSVQLTHEPTLLKKCNFYIIAVPTPVDDALKPDLGPLLNASNLVGNVLCQGDIVVYESTVYPGTTEEECVPVLEKSSGLKFGEHFTVGYSPERVNPGDSIHTLQNVVKIVSGSDSETCEKVASVYQQIVKKGVFPTSSIKVAEAAKVIENTQRDLNIALMNELALIFDRLQIPTHEVIEAASTKWNFSKFSPGLVGGHCIGVDPYYLTYKALEVGYQPEIILAGRKINDSIGQFIAQKTVKLLLQSRLVPYKAQILVLGFTFKENVCDVRNTKVIDIVHELKEWQCHVEVFDPMADKNDVKQCYGIDLLHSLPKRKVYDTVIIATAHDAFLENLNLIQSCLEDERPSVVVDVKSAFSQNDFPHSNYWSL